MTSIHLFPKTMSAAFLPRSCGLVSAENAQEVNKLVKRVAGDKAPVNCYPCHRGEVTPTLNPRGRWQ